MANATGPTKSSASCSRLVPFAARRAKVFLITLYSTPPSRSFLRRLVTVATSSLRNSSVIAVLARANFSDSSLMTTSFSLFNISVSPPHVTPLGGLDAWCHEGRSERTFESKDHTAKPVLGRAGQLRPFELVLRGRASDPCAMDCQLTIVLVRGSLLSWSRRCAVASSALAHRVK